MNENEGKSSGPVETSELSDALKRLRFRSYRPRDSDLQKYCEDTVDANDILAEIDAEHDALLSSSAAKFASPSLDLENMIPKKSNWDLKRAIGPKLNNLERRTQHALRDLQYQSAQRRNSNNDEERSGQILAQTVLNVELPSSDNEDDS